MEIWENSKERIYKFGNTKKDVTVPQKNVENIFDEIAKILKKELPKKAQVTSIIEDILNEYIGDLAYKHIELQDRNNEE
ncbi:hypothetical protein [Miniphocaeibacter massiliensis]|uniref:hypothetical protein n=1 Tax=Miniphocaeibacter massiliensis TaxID=2041841 RepID=UPI000C1C39AA|nr:hypothetical protein [Miniphocaeibacter massiliensis]